MQRIYEIILEDEDMQKSLDKVVSKEDKIKYINFALRQNYLSDDDILYYNNLLQECTNECILLKDEFTKNLLIRLQEYTNNKIVDLKWRIKSFASYRLFVFWNEE